MTENQDTQTPEQNNDKELNFRKLEAKFEKQLAQEREQNESRIRQIQSEYEQKLNQYIKPDLSDDDDDEDVYIDKKKLQKNLSSFEKNLTEKMKKDYEATTKSLLAQQQNEQWIKNHPDFYDVLKTHADTFAEKEKELAQDILSIPDPFLRQKAVYNNIKSLGLHKPKENIQDKINQNQRGPFYQPTGIGTSAMNQTGDFSPQGKKNAYEQMQELKARMRI